MKSALTIVRAMAIEGRHLHNCFTTQGDREHGWRLMQRARRICRRLGWKPEMILL